MMHEYFVQLGILVSIYIITVVSLNLAIGFTGMLNLGHLVYFGIGAYVSALLALQGVPWYAAMLAAGILPLMLGIAITAITSRLKGDYFAMVSLGLVFMAIAISRNWISLTRGALGLPGVPSIISNDTYYMLFAIAIAALSVAFFYILSRSEAGRIFQAIRDDETGAMVLGKNTYFYKMLSIAISAFFAGIAGSLLAHHLNFIDPTIFDIENLVSLIIMLIVGGLASIWGSVIGVVVFYALWELVRFIVVSPLLIGPVRDMAFVVILIAILLYRPRGILGKVDV